MNIKLRTRTPDDLEYTDTFEDFAQVPRVGEYLIRETGDDPWHLVELVAWHGEGSSKDCDVEIYAVKVDSQKVVGRVARESDKAISDRGDLFQEP